MSAPDASAFFVRDGRRFIATEWTRGPWSRQHQHGGPPAALLGHEVARCMGEDMQLARITLDLLRPVPIGPLSVRTEVRHTGRNALRIEVILESDGVPLAHGAALGLKRAEVAVPVELPEPMPAGPNEAVPFDFPFFDPGSTGYHSAMEVRIAEGIWGKGPVAAWLRMRVALVEGEPVAPLSRVLVAADSGNGISPVVDPRAATFVNADLSVNLHRLPVGEWVCLDARTRAEEFGIGLADTRLLDERGPIGRGVQSLLIRAR